MINIFHLWFQVLYLLQELIVLFYQLIVALRLGLLKLQGQKNTQIDEDIQLGRVCDRIETIRIIVTFTLFMFWTTSLT